MQIFFLYIHIDYVYFILASIFSILFKMEYTFIYISI